MLFWRFCFFIIIRLGLSAATATPPGTAPVGPCYRPVLPVLWSPERRCLERPWPLGPLCFEFIRDLGVLLECELPLFTPPVISILLNMPTNGKFWYFINGIILTTTFSKILLKFLVCINSLMFMNSMFNSDWTFVEWLNTMFRPFIISCHTTRNSGSLSTFRATYSKSPSVCATTSFVVTSMTASNRLTMALCAAGLMHVFFTMSWRTFSVRTLVSSVINDARLVCSVFSIPHTPSSMNISRPAFA